MSSLAAPYRIGVDVGGTNTDSVILDVRATNEVNRGVIAQHKTPTTSPNVTDGIESAVLNVLEQSKVPRDQIACLTIGTTHFINAIVEHDARRLSKVAIIRLSKSFTREVPPFSDFPPVLKSIMNGYYTYVDGGLTIDGAAESPINETQVVKECAKIKELGLDAVVISGVFSPIDKHFFQEDNVRKIIQRELPGVDIVCSSEVSQIGFLERENASILNASILRFARRTIRGFKSAMKRLSLNCPLYLTQNDGTLIDAPSASRLPIRTFSSGPTNSMRGAAYLGLSGPDDTGNDRTATIVVDIGGTTTDVGVLLPSGFPRQASAYVEVAGVKINFGMPHVESIGLGGGSIVRHKGANTTIGPDSVGHYLSTKGTVFGGDTLTATDIAVAAGAKIGNPDLVKDLDKELVSAAQARVKTMLETVIDQMKTSPAPLPVLLVGGGSILAPAELDGVSKVIFPPFHSVANAVGAAMSKVGGTVDSIESTAEKTVAEVVDEAKARAIEKAVASGAIRETVYLAEVDSMPLQYVANQVRVIARAVGELSPEGVLTLDNIRNDGDDDEGDDTIYNEVPKQNLETEEFNANTIDVATYRPKVVQNPQTGIDEWIVSETDVAWLADGCYVLGCAGGGSPFSEHIRIRDQIRQGHIIRIIDPYSVKKDAVIYLLMPVEGGGHMGSPAVSVERQANNETEQSIHALMEYLNHGSFDAVMGVEIGGGNGILPLSIGSSKHFDRPVVDADWMGMYQSSFPFDISDIYCFLRLAARPTTGDKMLRFGVLNTMSLAWRIGRCIARANATNTISTVAEQMIDEVGGPESGKILFRGKIVAVERRLFKGHSYGEITIQQVLNKEVESSIADELSGDARRSSTPVATGGVLKIPFKNENIYAKHISDEGVEKYVATVPDLICVLDTQSGKALGVPEFRYGVMVTVLGIACSPRWSDTERALEIGGPGAFGYKDIKYVPLGKYVEPKSVVTEYAERLDIYSTEKEEKAKITPRTYVDPDDIIKHFREDFDKEQEREASAIFTSNAVSSVTPYSTRYSSKEEIPKFKIPKLGARADAVHHMLSNELDLDGIPNLNMASFVGTYMDREANQLVVENISKNLADADEYPALMAIHARCISMISNLWNPRPGEEATGSATTGSSEAIMLGGLAMKKNWQQKRKDEGKDISNPNIIMGSNAQVALLKFARYFDVEARVLDVSEKSQFRLDPDLVKKNVDENTIGIFVILGSTYTGHYEPVEEISNILDSIQSETGIDVPIHVDAASGGFVAPFTDAGAGGPKWNFELPRVKSINASGHKYGLVYAGLGWIIWRDRSYLPKELIFELDYLGSREETYTLNFSRPGAQVIGQYYNFIRLGFNGYREIMENCLANARLLSKTLERTGWFVCLSDIHRKKGEFYHQHLDKITPYKEDETSADYNAGLPVVTFRFSDAFKENYPHVKQESISLLLRSKQYIIPNYPLPPKEQDTEILRVVVRESMAADLIDKLVADIAAVTERLMKSDPVDLSALQTGPTNLERRRVRNREHPHKVTKRPSGKKEKTAGHPMRSGIHRSVC
ncbi:uncharacterized protein ARB_01787 [Trichophyton benhamiae CBS 112371]|uniref:Glutamate decarboxylase n=1 Tax=Arthroderma benhamiae (strain ATCC MYA-4681 / CBS 112371) TaxID=663331 RepID=D4B016_ARTBC|nr:uncharacterized protein ARB_01787 [Trichophyton benhamiae CBS 112371]EFE31391.1 hypothetical protein ARB_01787 [Trichophyton benhamiae CBS 112371]